MVEPAAAQQRSPLRRCAPALGLILVAAWIAASTVSPVWSVIAAPPAPMVGSPNPGVPLRYAEALCLAGDEGKDFFRQAELEDNHPGFPRHLYRYNTVTDTRAASGSIFKSADGLATDVPWSRPVTTRAVGWRGGYVVPSGEVRPDTSTPRVVRLAWEAPPSRFGMLNWLALSGYLALLVVIGVGCTRREANTEAFFLGSRRIPWWAAGLSLFSTVLSAITYLAMPARAYATDWTLLVVNLCVVAVAPLIILYYLPVLRRCNVTTVYQYLALRFDASVQKFGSASFVLFQLGRMGIVLLLPALALSAVTGIPLRLCIILMGLLATLYTVLGGIEAVVWTDVLQTVVLLGGAVLALVLIANRLEGGFAEIVTRGSAAGKFHWVNLNASWVTDSLLVVVLGGVFSNALVPYSADQTVVQRYLSTKDEASARRCLWLGAAMVLPASLLFLFLGSALFVFFQEHPDALAPLEKVDQILPWFVISQMPAGLAGLVIAGVFAAAMSSLDSSMHSIATSVVTDWWRPCRPGPDEVAWLRRARVITLVGGLFGTLTALVLAGLEIQFLWDFFLGLLGLIGGTLAGVMAVGVFCPRVGSCHVWPAIIASLGATVFLKFFSPIHSLLLGFVGVTTVMLVSVALSFLVRQRSKKNPHLRLPLS